MYMFLKQCNIKYKLEKCDPHSFTQQMASGTVKGLTHVIHRKTEKNAEQNWNKTIPEQNEKTILIPRGCITCKCAVSPTLVRSLELCSFYSSITLCVHCRGYAGGRPRTSLLSMRLSNSQWWTTSSPVQAQPVALTTTIWNGVRERSHPLEHLCKSALNTAKCYQEDLTYQTRCP